MLDLSDQAAADDADIESRFIRVRHGFTAEAGLQRHAREVGEAEPGIGQRVGLGRDPARPRTTSQPA